MVAGDGRHDSMGHSAKFGAYTIFCCTLPMIIHFALIQVGKRSLSAQYSWYFYCFGKDGILCIRTLMIPYLIGVDMIKYIQENGSMLVYCSI